ncbi:TetR/AcrR family transcriptional regulator [Spirillospora sp. CA-142024]|uniref:TetR/AcrR family transcriptional regulator n=1 Tax=Spirillospora sp. CA-142024 TaxID=3240036 RepID=UPI003D8D44EC
MAASYEETRARLLHAAVDHVAVNGVSALSLRRLATALGTSHRMLVYYFGSKEGLQAEIVREVEERQRAVLHEIALSQDLPATARELWSRLTDPAMFPHERLFFEVYAQALQGRSYSPDVADKFVQSWLSQLTELNIRAGMPPETARPTARLGLAVIRGLLLDLLATGDSEGVTEALETFIDLAAGPVRPARG